MGDFPSHHAEINSGGTQPAVPVVGPAATRQSSDAAPGGLPDPAGKRCSHADAARTPPPAEREARHTDTDHSVRWQNHRSYKISQTRTHLLSRAEQTVLGGFLGRLQDFSDRPQPHSLIVAQLKNHALARRQLIENHADPGTQLPIPKASLRITAGAIFFDRIRPINRAVSGLD